MTEQIASNSGDDVTAEVYVALLNEGVDVYRPTPARYIDGHVFEILEPSDYDPSLEEWQFTPGTRVLCEMRHLSEGRALVAYTIAPAV